MRSIIHQMYPQANAELTRSALKEVRSHMDADGELNLSQFQDAVALMMEFFARKAESGDKTAIPVLHHRDKTVLTDFLSSIQSSRSLVGGRRPSSTSVAGRLSFQRGSADGKDLKSRQISPVAIAVPRTSKSDLSDEPADPDLPYDASKASVVHLKTSGGGIKLGHVSATNLPDELADLYQHTPGDSGGTQPRETRVLTSTVLARLASSGFAVAGMTNVEAPAGEMVYLLMRQAERVTPQQHPSRAIASSHPQQISGSSTTTKPMDPQVDISAVKTLVTQLVTECVDSTIDEGSCATRTLSSGRRRKPRRAHSNDP